MLWISLFSPAYAADLLFVGNSYTGLQNVDRSTAVVLSSLPGSEGSTGVALTGDGYRWVDHLARTEVDGPWREALVAPGYDADLVVLQEQSQIPGFPQDEPEWLASRDAAVALDALVADLGAETVLELTWGRRDGDPDNPSLYPDFPTMQDALQDGTLAYAAALGRPVTVAPVGAAFRSIYEDYGAASTEFTTLYAGDGSHPSQLGGYLAALVLASAITGLPTAGADPAEIAEADAAWLQSVADATVVDDPFGAFPYRWATPFDAWSGPIAGSPARPTVGLLAPFSLSAAVTVGGTAPGRLWVAADGDLGEVVLQAGGELVITAGRVTADAIRGPGSLILRDGATLVVGDGAIDVGAAQVDGVLEAEGCGLVTPLVADTLTGLGGLESGTSEDGRSTLMVELEGCAGDPPPEASTDGCGCGGGASGLWLPLLWIFAQRRRVESHTI